MHNPFQRIISCFGHCWLRRYRPLYNKSNLLGRENTTQCILLARGGGAVNFGANLLCLVSFRWKRGTLTWVIRAKLRTEHGGNGVQTSPSSAYCCNRLSLFFAISLWSFLISRGDKDDTLGENIIKPGNNLVDPNCCVSNTKKIKRHQKAKAYRGVTHLFSVPNTVIDGSTLQPSPLNSLS